MWMRVSTVAALCILLEVADAGPADAELDIMFQDRTKSDWEREWHQEKYTRCRETLVRHLYWACEKDIYRLTRRSQPEDGDLYSNDIDGYPWISERRAKRMLRVRRGPRRRAGSSITAECCSAGGCTWEEYAEYCPTNKRHTNFV